MELFIDDLRTKFDSLCDIVAMVIYRIDVSWRILPPFVQVLLMLVIFVAAINVILSLAKACIVNKSVWKPKKGSELMCSFLGGSAQYQRSLIYSDAHKFLLNKSWSYISFASIAFRIGNIEKRSKTILFVFSWFYVPLTILGITEMVFRAIIGIVLYFVLNLAYFTILLFLGIINMLLIPVFGIIDKATYETQHCPVCYSAYSLPMFKCPHCGKIHGKLAPGKTGLLWARCSCGHFLPCSSISKRKKLNAYCRNPKCNQPLPSANIKSLTVQIIGGNSSGKTACIAAFQHLYKNAAIEAFGKRRKIKTLPNEDFELLEAYYRSGTTKPSSINTVHVYYILHEGKYYTDHGIILYDVPDEIILNEQYGRNPLNFAYSDGVIIIIDPLSLRSVRNECKSELMDAFTNRYSDDSAEEIIIHFINKYSEITGLSARKMSDMPVAVVITKADIPNIKREIGISRIKAQYRSHKSEYQDFSEARDAVCRNYLIDIGLANSLNNLESRFSNISYFPVSAFGHSDSENTSYAPWGIIDPIDWISETSQNSMHVMTRQIMRKIK